MRIESSIETMENSYSDDVNLQVEVSGLRFKLPCHPYQSSSPLFKLNQTDACLMDLADFELNFNLIYSREVPRGQCPLDMSLVGATCYLDRLLLIS